MVSPASTSICVVNLGCQSDRWRYDNGLLDAGAVAPRRQRRRTPWHTRSLRASTIYFYNALKCLWRTTQDRASPVRYSRIRKAAPDQGVAWDTRVRLESIV